MHDAVTWLTAIQRQRVAIARALVRQTQLRILLQDEVGVLDLDACCDIHTGNQCFGQQNRAVGGNVNQTVEQERSKDVSDGCTSAVHGDAC